VSSSPIGLAAGQLTRLNRLAPEAGDAPPPGLLDAQALAPDPRDPRGVRHGLAAVLGAPKCRRHTGCARASRPLSPGRAGKRWSLGSAGYPSGGKGPATLAPRRARPALAAYLHKRGANRFFDLNPAVAEATTQHDWLFVDRVHYNDAGHDIVARIMARALELFNYQSIQARCARCQARYSMSFIHKIIDKVLRRKRRVSRKKDASIYPMF